MTNNMDEQENNKINMCRERKREREKESEQNGQKYILMTSLAMHRE